MTPRRRVVSNWKRLCPHHRLPSAQQWCAMPFAIAYRAVSTCSEASGTYQGTSNNISAYKNYVQHKLQRARARALSIDGDNTCRAELRLRWACRQERTLCSCSLASEARIGRCWMSSRGTLARAMLVPVCICNSATSHGLAEYSYATPILQHKLQRARSRGRFPLMAIIRAGRSSGYSGHVVRSERSAVAASQVKHELDETGSRQEYACKGYARPCSLPVLVHQ